MEKRAVFSLGASISLHLPVLFFIIFVRANRLDGIMAGPAGLSAWWVGWVTSGEAGGVGSVYNINLLVSIN